MDDLDIRILRTMGVRPYERRPKNPEVLKPSRIASEVGVTAKTVRSRIAEMEQAGVIGGYKLVPNLRHLGRFGEAYFFEFPDGDAKDAAIEEVSSMEGLLEVHDFLGQGLCVDFASRDARDRDAKLARLAELLGDDAPHKFYKREMPPVRRELSALDWRIVHAMRWDARKSLDEVADEVGVTGRTVRRRFGRMAEEGSVFPVPAFDPSKAAGLFLFEMLFYIEPPAVKQTASRLVAAYNGSHVYAYVPSSPELGSFDLLLFARTTEEVEELRRQGAAIDGVERAESWFFRGFHDFSDWIDDVVEARIEKDA